VSIDSLHTPVPRLRPAVAPTRWARRAPLLIAGGLLALEMATHLLDYGLDHPRVGLLDSGSEWSWSHIVATVAFAAAALAGVAGARRAGARRREWAAVAGLFGFLLLDNVTRLHTHVPAWPVFYTPILLGIFVVVWRLARDTPESVIVVVGLAALLVSLGIHVLGPHVVHALGWGSDTWAYQVKVGLKEGTELAGWVLVVPALWRLERGARG
jgi:uncharacterized protein YqgC (DUF456 family)